MTTFNLLDKIKPLVDDGYIRASRHPHLPLTIYNYTPKTQFEHKWDEITTQCRGLVLNDDGAVVIRCLPKFFNADEPEAAKMGEISCYMEKLDGYYISCKKDSIYGLIVTSRGSFDNQYVESASKLLADNGIIDKMPDDTSFFLELTQDFSGDEGIIVMRHETPELTCWAATDETGFELTLDEVSNYGIPVVKTFTESEMLEYLNGEVEGVVAKDVYNNRVKIKTQWYLNTHRIISNCTKKNVLEILKGGGELEPENGIISYIDKSGERRELVASTIPEEFYTQMVDWSEEMKQSFDYAKSVGKHYLSLTEKDDNKTVALSPVIPQFYKSLIFSLRKNKPIDDLLWGYVERHCLL